MMVGQRNTIHRLPEAWSISRFHFIFFDDRYQLIVVLRAVVDRIKTL